MSTLNVTVTNITKPIKVILSFDIEERNMNVVTALCRYHFPSVDIVDKETCEVIFTYYNIRQMFYPGRVCEFMSCIDPYIIKPEVQ